MKDINKDFMQFLIDKKQYDLMELGRNAHITSAWCLNKEYCGQKYYLVFLDEETHKNFNAYREIILNKTIAINEPINIYEVLIQKSSNQNNYIHDNLIIINFKEKILKGSSEINENIISNIEESFNFNVSAKENKKNILKENKGTAILVFANIIMFLISLMLNIKVGAGILDIDLSVLYKLGGLVNISLVGSEFYRFITNIFLHGGLTHIIFNMYALIAIGPTVEMVYGRKNFFIIYFVSGIGGAFLTSFTLQGVAIGASGAIFGLLGATLIFAYRAKKAIGKSFLFNILSVIGVNIIIGITIPNISNTAHMTGLFIGMLVSSIMYVYKYKKQ